MIALIFSTLFAFAQHENNGKAFRDEVDANLTKLEGQVQACKDKVTTIEEELPCVRRGAQVVDEYMQSLLKIYYARLPQSEQRGDAATSALKASQVEWTKYRRNLCTFIVQFHETDPPRPELREYWKHYCLFKSGVPRIREIFKLGWARTMR